MENQIWYDLNGTPTKLTDIRYGSFHYHADTGSAGRIRLGGVCSAYIEFDYYTSNGVTLNIGDKLEYHRYFPNIDNKFEDSASDLDYTQGIFFVTSLDAGSDLCRVVAYDSVSKLNVDFSEHLKSIESTFPRSLAGLLSEVTTVSGVTFDLTGIANSNFFVEVAVKYFYATGITCRDVVASIAAMCSYFVRATLNTNEVKFSAYGTTNSPWQNSGKYAICPDDGTYAAVGGGTATNVWYKENGLKLGEQLTPYNGVVVYWPDGTAHGDTTATDPYNFYFASSLFSGSSNMAYVKTRTQIGYALSVPSINAWYSGQIHLFPFRFPFKVGQVVHVYDESGTDHKFPIMSVDLSESDCVIESYTDKSVGNDTQWNEQGNGVEERSTALDVRVTALESQKIDGYTLVNFASASAGTISTYNSRSFSDYIWLVAEWVVNSSIRATTMFRRADFESAPYVSLFYVDSQNTQRWCELSYVDDTTLSITASSNASGNIALFGLALASS